MNPPEQVLAGSPRWEQCPTVVEWELTAPHGSARNPTWKELSGGGRDLDTREAEQMIRDLAGAGVSTLVLALDGAELREDLALLVRLAARDGLDTWLRSRSGETLGDQAAELVDAGLLGFSAPVDTPAPDQHDGASVAALETAQAAGLLLGAETAVTRWNIELLPSIRAAVGALGVARWHLHYPVPDLARMPTAEQVERSLQQLVEVEDDLDFVVELKSAPQFHRVRAMQGRRSPSRTRALGDGRGQMFVSYCGDIFPSNELPVPCGNLRMHDLLDVYRFHPTFRTLRDPTVLRGRCGGCEYHRVCGGSRARAYAMEGSLLGVDVLCPHSPRALLDTSFP